MSTQMSMSVQEYKSMSESASILMDSINDLIIKNMKNRINIIEIEIEIVDHEIKIENIDADDNTINNITILQERKKKLLEELDSVKKLIPLQ